MSYEIELDAAVFEDRLLDGRLTAQQGTQARQQFFQAERLRKIIIRSQIESFDPVLNGIAGTQDQHRLIEARFAPLAQQVDSVAIGQPEVENDRVMARFAEGVERLAARPDPSHDVGMLPQGSFDKRADAALIFDNEYFHGRMPISRLSRFCPASFPFLSYRLLPVALLPDGDAPPRRKIHLVAFLDAECGVETLLIDHGCGTTHR